MMTVSRAWVILSLVGLRSRECVGFRSRKRERATECANDAKTKVYN